MEKELTLDEVVHHHLTNVWRAGATGQGESISSAYSAIMFAVKEESERVAKVALEQNKDHLEDL